MKQHDIQSSREYQVSGATDTLDDAFWASAWEKAEGRLGLVVLVGWVLIAIWLSMGCAGRGPTSSDTPVGITSPGGRFVVVDGTATARPEHAAHLDEWWSVMEACVGRRADPQTTTVIVMAPNASGSSAESTQPRMDCFYRGNICAGGWTDAHEKKIWVLANYPEKPANEESPKHEMIHLLLRLSTESADANHDGIWWVTNKATGGPGLACQAR